MGSSSSRSASSPSSGSCSSCGSGQGSGRYSSPSSQENDQESEVDGVWRGFLAVSRRVPGGRFAPLERKGIGSKNREVVERARLQRERER